MRVLTPWTFVAVAAALAPLSGHAQNLTVHQAARRGDLAEVRRLVSEDGALATALDEDSRSPLHFAVARRHLEVVAFLMESGADIDAADREGETPLHVAARVAGPDFLRTIVDLGPAVDPLNIRDRTPLLLVARERGDPEMARILLDAGADVNAVDRYGATSLELAAWRGFEGLVDLFLDSGAEIPADPRALEMYTGFATEHGLSRLFGLLVEAGADLSQPNRNDGTLLHSASQGGNEAIVELLLEQGLDPNARDRYGWTALHFAAEEGHGPIAATLLERGADAAARTLAGYTPVQLALRSEAESVLSALKTRGTPGALEKSPGFPRLDGGFYGQAPPGSEPTLFAPDIVSTHRFEHGSITFSPQGDEAFWTSSFIVDDSGYTRGRIMSATAGPDGWLEPGFASFSTDYVGDDVPHFHPNGQRMFFLSSRVEEGVGGEHIWYVDREREGWSDPVKIQGGPNDMSKHWGFSVAANGNLYFNSGDVGGLGSGDIYVSRYQGGVWLPAENLGAPVNSEYNEFSPFVAPDESYLIVSIHDHPEGLGSTDLFISFRQADGAWGTLVNMGPTINSPASDLCPWVTVDGRYLFFNSHRGGESDIFWVDGQVIRDLKYQGDGR